jgi:uncharacterized surface protein with fasciclin (FAS1) repeats
VIAKQVLGHVALATEAMEQPIRIEDMRKLMSFAAAALAMFAVSGVAQADKPTESQTIVEVAAGAETFKTLVAAVTAADLATVLSGEGPFTVFAPTDEAFEKLPEGTVASLLKPENKEKLVGILTYHVVAGKVTAKEVTGLTEAKTVQGTTVDIKVQDGNVMIDKAKVVKADILCKNGVIHVIDTVLLPE